MEKESTSERKEREFEEDCFTPLLLFAAGTALLMACFKRPLMVFFLEEWRLWVFLFLNLLLLSILFTSTLSAPKDDTDNGDPKKKKSPEEERGVSVEREVEICGDFSDKKAISRAALSSKSSERAETEAEAGRLSKEELKERAEAFIVMFRQHLVLDARKCGKQALFEKSARLECVKLVT